MQRRIGRQLLVTNAIRVSTQLILESGKEPFDATKPEWTRKLNKKESWTKLVLHGWKYFRGRFACNDIGGYFERKYCTILNIVLCNMYVWIRKVVWVVFFILYGNDSKNSWYKRNKFNKLWYRRYILMNFNFFILFLINNSYNK